MNAARRARKKARKQETVPVLTVQAGLAAAQGTASEKKD